MILDNNQILFMGIDGGGTNCRVRIESVNGQFLGSGIAGSANPSVGMEVVVKSILNATNAALSDAQLPLEAISQLVVGAGLAGLHLTKHFESVAAWQHPFKKLYLTDDLVVANLGAHDGKDGAMLIAGTGFSALSVVNGDKTAIGGYGFLMGDQCSGSWIGYQAVQSALLAYDKLAPETQLEKLLDKYIGRKGGELAEILLDATPRDFAALAPFVFEAAENNDSTANQILTKSADFISRVVGLLLKSKPPRLSLIGGIIPRISARLDKQLTATISAPLNEPEVGAIYFARDQFNQQNQWLANFKGKNNEQ